MHMLERTHGCGPPRCLLPICLTEGKPAKTRSRCTNAESVQPTNCKDICIDTYIYMYISYGYGFECAGIQAFLLKTACPYWNRIQVYQHSAKPTLITMTSHVTTMTAVATTNSSLHLPCDQHLISVLLHDASLTRAQMYARFLVR